MFGNSIDAGPAPSPAPHQAALPCQLSDALDRHLAWATDFLAAADFGSAAEALLDAAAVAAECRDDAEWGGRRC